VVEARPVEEVLDAVLSCDEAESPVGNQFFDRSQRHDHQGNTTLAV
jgi:hypothetical protein